jgi:hypothetical protein
MIKRITQRSLVLLSAVLLLLGMYSPPASPQSGAGMDAGRPPYSKADWALLPEWCVDTQDNYGSPNWPADYPNGRNASPRSDYWTSIFGKDFWHMHHYCRALYFIHKADFEAMPPQRRLGAIERAIGDLRYVLKYCKQSNLLMPEFYYRLGEAELRRNNKADALHAFATARRLKPDYWPAYSRWADELTALRLYASALELIEQGLKHAPDQPELRKRQDALIKRLSSPS